MPLSPLVIRGIYIFYRTTAKKFHAASNFLQILKVFPKSDVSESVSRHQLPFSYPLIIQNEDKIRYAKWKAADISKAFREGRKPTPGPAGQIEDLVSFEQPGASSDSTKLMHQPATQAVYDIRDESPTRSANSHRSEGDVGSTNSTSISSLRQKKAWVSDDVEEMVSPSSLPQTNAIEASEQPGSLERKDQTQSTTASSLNPFLEYSSKVPSQAEVYQDPSGICAPSPRLSPPPLIPQTGTSSPASCSHMNPLHVYPDQTASNCLPPKYSAPSVTASAPPSSMELAPEFIAKAQKHCRFAISSLDYEDVEQAKKELRTALALLGGL